MDIMYLNGKPVLHIIDSGTHFSAARFLSDVSNKALWSTITESWACIYTVLPKKIRVDQCSDFGGYFASIARASDVSVERTGVEAHYSLGIGERYHQPLRTTFRKLRISYPKVSDNLLLSISVSAINNTLGPEGLVPSALIFGEFPQLNIFGEPMDPKSTFETRSRIAIQARKEMEQHMARMKLQRALRHQVPSAADTIFEHGQKVLVWCEMIIANRIGEWVGPLTVVQVDQERKLVYVQESEGKDPRPFSYV